MSNIPFRTCRGCNQKKAQAEMRRLFLSEGKLQLGKGEGRGYYICLEKKCTNKSLVAKKMTHFLKTPITEAMLEELKRALN